MRAISAVALTFSLTSSLSSAALADNHSGMMQRVSCTMVRYYVEKYSASTAELWARSHGASEAQIAAARRCLREPPAQTVQAARWYAQ